VSRAFPAWIWAVLAFLALAAVRERRRPAPSAEVLERARAYGVELDPRRMSSRELRQLPGVGSKLALGIAAARDAHADGSPLAWEDVPGIGEVRAREIRAWCIAHGIEPDPLGRAGAACSLEALRYAHDMETVARTLAWSLAFVLAGCRESRPVPAPVASAPASAGGDATLPSSAPAGDATKDATVASLVLQEGALHARAAGSKDAPLVLLLHGGRYSAQTWEDLGTLTRLAAAGYRAVALDWPGHGATPAWDGEPDAATLLTSVCDELGAERLVFVGASMGGGLALDFLKISPARAAAFVGIAPAGADAFAPEGWSTPTLLFWGERDEVLPLARGQALAQRLGARLEVIPGASHACYLDQPERFHAVLFEFLAHAFPPAGRR
jgi:abhydrolase domain-containing protein 14